MMGTAVAQWLRCCATNQKVAGSIPDGAIGIFLWHNPSDRTMALGSTQSLTEMSTRRISWGKSGRCVRLTTLPPFCAVVMKFGNLNFLEPSGPLQACNGTDLPFFYTQWYLHIEERLGFMASLEAIMRQLMPLLWKKSSSPTFSHTLTGICHPDAHLTPFRHT